MIITVSFRIKIKVKIKLAGMKKIYICRVGRGFFKFMITILKRRFGGLWFSASIWGEYWVHDVSLINYEQKIHF